MQRSFTIVLSADVNRAAALYENLSGMTRHFDSDWFVILTQASIEGLEFGILQRDPAIIPPDIRAAPAGAARNCVIPTIQYWTSVLQRTGCLIRLPLAAHAICGEFSTGLCRLWQVRRSK